MNKKMVILVDDKEEVLSTLLPVYRDSKDFAQACFNILQREYRANIYEIDQDALDEGAMGHLIGVRTGRTVRMAPREWLANRLASYSNYGLKKCGLTRAQYNKHLERTDEAALNSQD